VRLKDTEKVITVVSKYGPGCQHGRAIVDPKLLDLTCADCGDKLNPIEFLVGLATQERIFKHQQESISAARAALEERKKCRCTKCGEWTEIRRVGNREIARLHTQGDGEKP
jgi:hypothetical protein